jgi:hypothetical protein
MHILDKKKRGKRKTNGTRNSFTVEIQKEKSGDEVYISIILDRNLHTLQ